MTITPSELMRARLALQKAVGRNLFDRARRINLIDIALYEENGQVYDVPAIRYHVDDFIPSMGLESMGRTPLQLEPIDGVPTMVVRGSYRPQQWWPWWPGTSSPTNPRLGRSDPLNGGVSISTGYSGSGTLGGIVRDRASGRPMLLSNWHVIVTYWGAPRGQPILQPGRDDGGSAADAIAELERDAMAANLDAAVAFLNDRRRPSNAQLDIGPVTRTGKATLGMIVQKSGRSSGRTYGRVTGIEGVLRMRYNWVDRQIRRVITIESTGGEVSRPGDSGSWWLASGNGDAVGLHFAGSNYPERGLALDMGAVLDALDVDIWR